MFDDTTREMLVTLTAQIVAAHVSNNGVPVENVPSLIQDVYGALASLDGGGGMTVAPPEPAVKIAASVKHDHIVCLEDGKKFKVLKRHLLADHGMTPAEYRARWRLPLDYPMVAQSYSDKRRAVAKALGLGHIPAPGAGRPRKAASAG